MYAYNGLDLLVTIAVIAIVLLAARALMKRDGV